MEELYRFNNSPSSRLPIAYCCFPCAERQLKQGNEWMSEQIALGYYDVVNTDIAECNWHLDYQTEEDSEE